MKTNEIPKSHAVMNTVCAEVRVSCYAFMDGSGYITMPFLIYLRGRLVAHKHCIISVTDDWNDEVEEKYNNALHLLNECGVSAN